MCVLTDTVYHYFVDRSPILDQRFNRLSVISAAVTLLLQDAHGSVLLSAPGFRNWFHLWHRITKRYTHVSGITMKIQNLSTSATSPSIRIGLQLTYRPILRSAYINKFRPCCTEVGQNCSGIHTLINSVRVVLKWDNYSGLHTLINSVRVVLKWDRNSVAFLH
jgi:hypothetical protein